MKKPSIQPDIEETTIAQGMNVRGDINCENDIWINGEVEGNVTTQGYLTLGQSAHIEGHITGRHIRLGGRVQGNVTAQDSLICDDTAFIKGDVNSPDLTVESGAVLNGTVTMPAEEQEDDDSESEEE